MTQPNMYLYGVTLQAPQSITHCLSGNFTGESPQELLVVRGTRVIELIRVDANFKLQTVLSTDIFGVIRSVQPFRLPGAATDDIIVGSDSGKIAILKYNKETNQLHRVHLETFGKSGCRRIVPGQYVAVDPKVRAVMIAGIEKQKFVYTLSRDAAARLTISSPLEAHRSRCITLHCVGVDMGYENPVFACLEMEYEEAEEEESEGESEEEEEGAEMMLTFYELDLGLNHVVRKWSDAMGFNANMLVTVPGGNEGPSGVLVCAENLIIYKNQGCEDRVALLPRRKGLPLNQPLLIVSAVLLKKRRGAAANAPDFSFLLQSELGDLYEATLDVFDGEVRNIDVRYFDTLPVCSSLCVMRGFLFAASEFGNHSLYQIRTLSAEEDKNDEEVEELEAGEKVVSFRPGPLKRLVPIDKLQSASPILDMQIADLYQDESRQIYAMCGRGHNSSLRVLRHGIPVSEVAASMLPSIPNGIWTVRRTAAETVDSYIVVSFTQGTIVLAIGDGDVQEVNDSGFENKHTTLSVSLLGDDAMLQIHPEGIRHVRSNGRKHDWKPPGKTVIVKAAVNRRQVAIALSGGLIHYFELDDTGQLLEVDKKEMGQEISAIDIAPIAKDRTRSRFLTVATGDNTVRSLSLDPTSCLSVLAVQKLPEQATSLCMVYLDDGASGTGEGHEGISSLYLNIGLHNGVVLRTVMDPQNGSLTDTRARFLGARPAKLFRVSLRGAPAILALSTRPWLGYAFQKRFHMTPLSYQNLEFASSFSSEQCPDGIVSISQNTMRIFTVDKLGDSFNQTVIPLRYTPRASVVHPEHRTLAILQSDHKCHPLSVRQKMEAEDTEGDVKMEDSANGTAAKEPKATTGEEEEEEEEEIESNVLPLPAPANTWASCLHLVNPSRISSENDPTDYVTDVVELDENEAALCMCLCPFEARSGELMLVVGTAVDYTLTPRSCSGGYLRVFKYDAGGAKLVLEHATPLEDAPTALAAFQGKLLVGIGTTLRIYDMGKRRLLRKSENKNFYHGIIQIHVDGSRIIVGDVADSFVFCRYRKDTNAIHIFADDTVPRYLSAGCQLDFNTMAGADKFGNVFIVTLPPDVSETVEDDPTGTRINWFNHGLLNGAPNKLQTCINYHTGDIVTSMHKATLISGGDEAIICGTISGAIIAFVPVTSKSEVNFLQTLEMHMRQEKPPLCGRDHLAYRSYYFPVKSVVDGDLCEQFSNLPFSKQREVADELDSRTPGEVTKKLEDIRNHVL